MKTLLALFMIVSFEISFVQAQETLDPNRIIGVNDFVLVKTDLSNIPLKFRSSMAAIGKLSSGCTVTHIGQGYAVTAGHCFWQTFFDEELKLNETCSTETITWAWTEGSHNNKTSQCLEVIAMQRSETENLDFAIMKISDAPAAQVDIEWKKKPKAGSFVTIFSYPEEAPLSWSKSCRIKKITGKDVLPGLMHHVCDTLTGSSGAAVLDVITGKIVGLHKAGDGETLEDGTTTPAVENYAMYITQSPMKNLLIKSGYIIK